MSSKKKPKRPLPPSRRKGMRIYTLETVVIGGPMTDEFLDANPVVSRTFLMLGDQTLEKLHWAIFKAFGRDDDHMYEFQFGSQPMQRGAANYVMHEDAADDFAGLAPRTTLDDLDLTTGKVFFYWFDFGDDWWHSIKVAAIDLGKPAGDYPRVVASVGASPPQYPFLDDEEYYDEEDEDFDDDEDEGGPIVEGVRFVELDEDGPIIEGVRFVELDEDGEEKPAPERDAGDDPKPRP